MATPIPDAEILAELQNDPNGMGYDVTGTTSAKTTKELLNLIGGRREIANPDPAPQIPKPLDMATGLSIVPSAERASFTQGTVSRIRELIETGDSVGLQLLFTWMVDRHLAGTFTDDVMTTTTAAALQSKMAETHADPNHPATILDPLTPRTQVLWGGNTDAEQVERVLGR